MNLFTFATLNYKEFGLNPRTGIRDLDTLAVLLRPAAHADVLVLCECVGAEQDGARLRLRVQAMVAELWKEPAQAFVSYESRGPLPKLTIVRARRIEPLQHFADPHDPQVHAAEAGQLRCRFSGVERPVTIEALHLDPFDGDARLSWAKTKGSGTAPGALTVMIGDVNGLWPGHPDLDWSRRLPHHSHHKTLETPNGRVADLRAMAELERQGWGFAAALAKDWTPTVNPHGPDSVCPVIDGIVISSELIPAVLPDTYQVHDPDSSTHRPDGTSATDHKLVLATLDFDACAASTYAAPDQPVAPVHGNG